MRIRVTFDIEFGGAGATDAQIDEVLRYELDLPDATTPTDQNPLGYGVDLGGVIEDFEWHHLPPRPHISREGTEP